MTLPCRLGLDRRASGIVTHLFASSPATPNVATATSLVFVTAGTLAVASSLQQIYEKAFHQDHRGLRGPVPVADLGRCAMCRYGGARKHLVGRPVRTATAGAGLAELVTFAIMDAVLLVDDALPAGRPGPMAPGCCPRLIATGIFFAGLGVFSKFYFSSTIISDSRTYGTDWCGPRHPDLVYRLSGR